MKWPFCVALLLALLFDPVLANAATLTLTWTESGRIRIRRAELNGSNAITVFRDPDGGSPQGIAFDPLAGHVYWIERLGGLGTLIRRANLDSSDPVDVFEEDGSPLDIALDAIGNAIYRTDQDNDKVARAAVDGSGVESLVTGRTAVSAIGLDVAGGKMCWSNEISQRIYRANLDDCGR